MLKVQFIDKNVVEYAAAWELQKEIFEKVSCGEDDYLLFCEHPHVFTLGRSGEIGNLLVDESFLKSINATFFKTDRGGDITYHGYGQLVGYPILNIGRYGLSLKKYIECIEECVIKTLQDYGVVSGRVEGATGVWVGSEVDAKKICAIGVKASRYITMHGFALNVNTDLRYFNYINPCGFTERGVTSLQELLGREVDMSELKERFLLYFAQIFSCEIKK